MDNSELKKCPLGCSGTLTVRDSDAVQGGYCGTRGPAATRLVSRVGVRLASTAMHKALAMHLWNLRGANLLAKASRMTELAASATSVSDFEARLSRQGLYNSASPSGSSGEWAECLRTYKSLTQGVEYKIVGSTQQEDIVMLKVIDSYDVEVLAPANVFGRA